MDILTRLQRLPQTLQIDQALSCSLEEAGKNQRGYAC